MSEGKPATPGQAASLGEVYWIAARQRKIAQGGAAPSSWALLGADLRGICEAGAEAVAMHLAAPGPHAADGKTGAMTDAAQAQAALARVLSWFKPEDKFGSYRYARATRAQLAHAYADGGLTVPEELRMFL